MTLKKYQSKRSFDDTAEPKGKIKASKGLPLFCVQKHDASHLHYDFRLEHKGVLLSWAVPKGPSMNPRDKRLAIHVEDHPYDYHDFEGVIPKGNYGAGTVMLWDEGRYTVPGASTKKEVEKAIEAGLKKGHLEFVLEGEKLKGLFNLVKIKSDDKDNWLLIKSSDEHVGDMDLEEQDYSVRTQRSTKEIGGGRVKRSKKPKKKLPGFIKPMLATLVDEPFDDKEWLFETKWDGYRALAYVDGGVQLYSRNENDFNGLFPSIARELTKLGAQAILDGEIVVLDENGRSDFQLMQNYQRTQEGALYYYVFDLLWLDGEDLRELPLWERKERLKALLESTAFSHVRFSDHVVGKGSAFFKAAAKHHLEGIVAKQRESVYSSRRSKEWLKIKTHLRQEAVIGGFTEPRGSRSRFGALLLGVYNGKGELTYIGHVGTGFNAEVLDDVYSKMKPLIQKTSPFSAKVKTNMAATWVKPKLVCEVSFSEWTSDGIMRQPTFEGLRLDKKAKQVKKEEVVKGAHSMKKESKTVVLSHPDKIYWPKQKYTKQDLFSYYQEIASYILPYLKNRPMVLRRFPDGIEGGSFIQKDTQSLHLPPWIQTVEIQHETKPIHYFLIQDKPSLEYVVNLGSIELHPFHARIDTLDYPDYFVLDLDPESVPFNIVMETALTIHEMFDEMEIPHYCKTSGGRGLHITIPLRAKYTVEQVAQFGQILATLVHEELPKITSLERSPSKRQKKIYLDVLQNRSMQTIVAPYSVRGKPFATVSTPLEWKELKKGLSPQDFTIKTVPARLKKIGDIYAPVLGKGFNLKSWLKDIEQR